MFPALKHITKLVLADLKKKGIYSGGQKPKPEIKATAPSRGEDTISSVALKEAEHQAEESCETDGRYRFQFQEFGVVGGGTERKTQVNLDPSEPECESRLGILGMFLYWKDGWGAPRLGG